MHSKNRINTRAMFQNIIGHEESQNQKENINNQESKTIETKIESKQESKQEKNIQISIYLPPNMDKNLSVQGAMKEKESDKSSIARSGIEIVLGLSKEIYLKLKQKEQKEGISKSKIIEEALKKYLN